MPTPTSYEYTISTDIPSGLVSVARLRREIELSSIVTQIDYVAGGITAPGDDSLTLWFKDPLTSGEKTTLDGLSSQTPNSPASGGSILGDHSGVALPDDPQNVVVTSGSVTVTGEANGKILSPNNVDYLGDNSNPVRVDPTGTTTQPVSVSSLPLPSGAATESTLAALNVNSADIEAVLIAIRDTAGIKKITDALPAGTNNIGDVDVVSSALPTGAATETTLSSINTKTLAAGQAVMAASSPVVLASDQTVIPISDNGGSLTVDGTVIANQGTAAGLAGYWPVRVTDGTNTMPTGDVVARSIFQKITDGTNTAAVKAASTAVVASDPSLAVGLSPNSPVPTGTNTIGKVQLRNPSNTLDLGDSTNPLRIDPTGTTTQPVSHASGSQVDGHSASIGNTADADTTNTVIGRLKQIITRLAGGLPAALVGGRLDSNIGSWFGSTTPTVGQKANTSSVPATISSDQVGTLDSTAPTQAFPLAARQIGATTLRALTAKYDDNDLEYRLLVDAKTQIVPPTAPPSTTPRTIVPSGALSVTGNSTDTYNYTIPNAVTFTLQQVITGAEGDPNERGSKVTIFYVDSSSVTHVIQRIYLQSTTTQVTPETSQAVDGTALTGNGTTTQIRIDRTRLGGGNAEIDVVVRGYES